MKQRNALKVFETLDNFLAKYRVDLENGKIYNKQNDQETALKKHEGYYVLSVLSQGKAIDIKRSHLVFWAGHGYLPDIKSCIDHKDGNKMNDSISNLQNISVSENNLKQKLNNRQNGYYGVFLNKRYNTYEASIKLNKKKHYFGSYPTKELAAAARDKGVIKLFRTNAIENGQGESFMPPLNFPELLQQI